MKTKKHTMVIREDLKIYNKILNAMREAEKKYEFSLVYLRHFNLELDWNSYKKFAAHILFNNKHLRAMPQEIILSGRRVKISVDYSLTAESIKFNPDMNMYSCHHVLEINDEAIEPRVRLKNPLTRMIAEYGELEEDE